MAGGGGRQRVRMIVLWYRSRTVHVLDGMSTGPDTVSLWFAVSKVPENEAE